MGMYPHPPPEAQALGLNLTCKLSTDSPGAWMRGRHQAYQVLAQE